MFIKTEPDCTASSAEFIVNLVAVCDLLAQIDKVLVELNVAVFNSQRSISVIVVLAWLGF